MKLLLDTQSWLWFVLGDVSLSTAARQVIEDPANQKHVSPASFWEIAIKISIGKYSVPVPLEAFLQNAIDGQGFAILAVMPAHAARVSALPFHHRDPFDRLLVAQSLAEEMALVSSDSALDQYGVRRIW